MSIRPAVIVLVALAALAGHARSQQPLEPPTAPPPPAEAPARAYTARDRVEAMKRSLQASLETLRRYEWVETATVFRKGRQKSEQRQRCRYGAGGSVERAPVEVGSGAGVGEPGGRRSNAAWGLKGSLADLAREAVALVRTYIPPDPVRIEEADIGGRITVGDPDHDGRVRLVIRDYMKPGDYLTAVLDAATNRFDGLTVATYTDTAKHGVTMNLVLGVLPDGTLHPATILLDIEQEEVRVTIENSGYRAAAP